MYDDKCTMQCMMVARRRAVRCGKTFCPPSLPLPPSDDPQLLLKRKQQGRPHAEESADDSVSPLPGRSDTRPPYVMDLTNGVADAF